MEEKLEEIILKAEERLSDYKDEIDKLRQRWQFLHEHGFHIEKEWVANQKDSKVDMYYDFKNTVEEIRGLLNLWNS